MTPRKTLRQQQADRDREQQMVRLALREPATSTPEERAYDELEAAIRESSARYERLLLRQAELAAIEDKMRDLEVRVNAAITAVERFVVSLEPGTLSEPQRRQMARALAAAAPTLRRVAGGAS